jgi:hypothetical protein
MDALIKNYRRYRWFYTSTGKLVIGGKTAAQNDELLHQVTARSEPLLVMHTLGPGSPFCVILASVEKITKADREECAIFTACFSRAWRAGASKAAVDAFLSSQLYKEKQMKPGTWGVETRIERFNAPLKLALTRQKGVLRAVPPQSVHKKEIIACLCPGTLDKRDLLPKLELEIGQLFASEEVLAAAPAGGSKLCKP